MVSTPDSVKPAKAPRIASLDIIRGIAILGVLAVNADGFAAPIHASLNPAAWPFGNAGATAIAYWIMDWLFHEKFVAIFSMLFGISLFLVGGELADRMRGKNLARRLTALFGFALFHGFVLWWGDILFTYACAGTIMFFLRSLSARVLTIAGGVLIAVAVCHAIPVHQPPAPEPMAANATVAGPNALQRKVTAEIDQARGSAAGAFRLNAQTYVHQLQNVWRLLPETIGLMMLGLGLYKIGFFSASLSSPVYRRTASAGLLALAVIGVVTWQLDVAGHTLRWANFIDAILSPVVAVGYVAVIVLTMRGSWKRSLAPFAATGRMAFTNYLTQSLIMTSIFYGGRGALMGQVDRPTLWAIVVAVWVLQLCLSVAWLSRFEMGPMEWLWRWATYGRRSPFVRQDR